MQAIWLTGKKFKFCKLYLNFSHLFTFVRQHFQRLYVLIQINFTLSGFLKILIVFLVSSIKFLFAPALSFSMGLNFIQTWLSTTAGGIVGVIFFFFLSKWVLMLYSRYFFYYFHLLRTKIYRFLNLTLPKIIPARRFTRRNRMIIKIVNKFGMFGIVILTPVLLSIPLGTFIATRYYSANRFLLVYLSASVLFWSLFMSSAISLF
jgi:hypothetical protein